MYILTKAGIIITKHAIFVGTFVQFYFYAILSILYHMFLFYVTCYFFILHLSIFILHYI